MITLDYASEDGGNVPAVTAAKAAGVRSVIIRKSYCYFDTSHGAFRLAADTAYERDAQLWRDGGIIVGSYIAPSFHAGAPSPAEQVANWKVSAGEVHAGKDLPPAIDVEFVGSGVADTGLTQTACLALVEEYVQLLEQVAGCTPMIYTSHVMWCDSNGLGGPQSEIAGRCPLWQKTPYRLGARMPLDQVNAAEPHIPAAGWDKNDYWRVPPPWVNCPPVLQQWQGDCLGFQGVNHTVDVGSWLPSGLNAYASHRLGSDPGAVQKFQTSKGLADDGIIGPATFAALAWP